MTKPFWRSVSGKHKFESTEGEGEGGEGGRRHVVNNNRCFVPVVVFSQIRLAFSFCPLLLPISLLPSCSTKSKINSTAN